MNKINLTDQELNEWVAKEIFKEKEWFNYCTDLNETRLMEEKILEMGKGDDYGSELVKVTTGDYENDLDWRSFFDLAYASARQRVEAAYLTFNKEE